METQNASAHSWRFFRAGGFDQVRLDRGEDLMALDRLDQKLWVALACPADGLHFDGRTLGYIDTDSDGRVRAPELIAAVKWAGGLLKNPDDLIRGPVRLPLEAVDDTTPAGQRIVKSMRRILANLGKPDAASIEATDTADLQRIFQSPFNGDGIITPKAAPNEEVAAVIQTIVETMGSRTDRSGDPGIDQALVDAFFAEAEAFSDWRAKPAADPSILVLDEATPAASDAIRAVAAKVEDFFARCRLAHFDPRATQALNREEAAYLQTGGCRPDPHQRRNRGPAPGPHRAPGRLAPGRRPQSGLGRGHRPSAPFGGHSPAGRTRPFERSRMARPEGQDRPLRGLAKGKGRCRRGSPRPPAGVAGSWPPGCAPP